MVVTWGRVFYTSEAADCGLPGFNFRYLPGRVEGLGEVTTDWEMGGGVELCPPLRVGHGFGQSSLWRVILGCDCFSSQDTLLFPYLGLLLMSYVPTEGSSYKEK